MRLRPSYTRAEFTRLLSRESDRLERKTGVGQNPIQETMVAFSNSDGGIIFIGVRDDGTIVGKKLDQGTDERINEVALNARDVGRYHLAQIDVDGVPVVAVHVEKRIEGFSQTSNGRILVRRGPRNAALFGPDLVRFVSERTLQRFEETDSGLHGDVSNPELVNELIEAYGWSNTTHLHDRLMERGLHTNGGNLTIAGSLFLTDPASALRQTKAVIEIRRYPEAGEEYDRREVFSGPIHHQVANATRFISDELGSDLVVTGLYRHELPRLPEVVIREAIANAVAHRSYEAQGTPIIVEMRPEVAIVTSPGGLPEPVTVENMRQAQAARNHDTIDVLRRFRLAEDAGRGVDIMQDSMEDALLDPPAFEDLGHAVRVSLPLRGPITPRERAWVADLQRRGEISGPDRLLLVHAARGEQLTNGTAREILNVGHIEARAALRRLRDAGLLVQHGIRGGARYTLVAEIAPPAAFRMSPPDLENLVVREARKAPLSNERVRNITGLERAPALALLRRLVEQGRLRRYGQRRGTRYRAK